MCFLVSKNLKESYQLSVIARERPIREYNDRFSIYIDVFVLRRLYVIIGTHDSFNKLACSFGIQFTCYKLIEYTFTTK